MGMRCLARTAIILAALLSPAAGSADTLRDALVAAYDNSNLLEQNRAVLRASDEDVAVALSALRPQINANSSVDYGAQSLDLSGGDLSATVGLGLDLLVWDGGATQLAVEAAKETTLATRAQLVGVEQQVLFGAVQAYVSVLRDQQVVALRENNLRLINQELRSAQERFDVGEVTRTDVAQAEARVAAARGDLENARGNLTVSQSLYRTATGISPRNLVAITSLPGLPKSVQAARALGEQNAPSIIQAQHQIKANELNAARARAATKPRIGVGAGVGRNSQSGNSSSVGLSLTMPIYQGGQLSALSRRALAAVHASRANLHQSVLLVRQDVADSWTRLVVANAQVTASRLQIRAAQTAFDGVREEAKLGVRTTLDVLDAEQALFDAQTNLIVNQSIVNIAAYQLLASMGLLTADNLNLAVKRYDPSEYYNAVKTAPLPSSEQGRKLDRILQRYSK